MSDGVFLKDASGRQVVEMLTSDKGRKATSLAFRSGVFLEEDAAKVGDLLASNTTLTRLNLMSHLDAECMKLVARGIAKNSSILSVELQGLRPQCKDFLVEMLHTNQGLEELDLTRNPDLGDEALLAIVQAALQEGRIDAIYMHYSCSARAVDSICALLAENNLALKNFGVSKICGGEVDGRLVAELLRRDRRLEELSLADCSLSGKAVCMIAEAMEQNRTLTSLSLSGCSLVGAGAALERMLATNSTLECLILADSMGIEDQGADWIVRGMQKNCGALTKLYLTNTELTKKGLACIADMLQTNKTLQALHLREIRVGSEGDEEIKALARAVAQHPALEFMYWPSLSTTVLASCEEILQKNGSLLHCGMQFEGICKRNAENRSRARLSVMTLLLVRWGRQENILHALPKDVVKLVAKQLWETRTQIETWSKNKNEPQ